MKQNTEHLNESILKYARKDFPLLLDHLTIREALEIIREKGVGEKIIYFYVVDESERLVGVLPTRRLLISPADKRLSDIMITRVVAIPQTATVLEACEMFVLHKFFAFPVVDQDRHIQGMVDVSLFTDEVFDLEERRRMDEVFESLGFRVTEVRDASPIKAFRYRFPWLLATIASGTVCAVLAGAYETTLAQSLVLAFFLTLVLGLGESVSTQSMTVTIQSLRSQRPTLRWYAAALRRELGAALLLGGACGVAVGLIVLAWRGAAAPAFVVGSSILLSLVMACWSGLSVPAALHALKLDPKISAGPITLALADIFTLLFYFNMGKFVLGAG